MNVRALLALTLICGLLPIAQAETEGFAYQCEGKTCFWRRPIVNPPPGWIKDEESGHEFRFNAFVRKGEIFTKSDAVMYALAIYKKNASPTLAEQMNVNRETHLKEHRDAKVAKGAPVQNADGKRLATITYTPGSPDDDWQTVAYDEEGDYYLLFALTARDKRAHDRWLPALAELVRGYSKEPKKR